MNKFLPELLKKYAKAAPNKIACMFLNDGINISDTITYGELDLRATIIAQNISESGAIQQPMVLLFPTGIEFIVNYIACLYAQAIAIPVSWPNRNTIDQTAVLLAKIISETTATKILTSNKIHEFIQQLQLGEQVSVITTENLKMKKYPYNINSYRDILITHLQYTSGSTGVQKAAIVTHRNIMHALQNAVDLWGYSATSITVNASPHTFAYGLLYCWLLPLYTNSLSINMPDELFAQQPYKWLAAISKFRATHAGTSNFGYELCTLKTSRTKLSELDFTAWKVAINGGEPIQAQTLLKFVKKFQACGFRIENFICAYGMSEATGLIASNKISETPSVVKVALNGLTQNKVITTADNSKTFISYKNLVTGLRVSIKDLRTNLEVTHGEIGMIYLNGPTITQGYWGTPINEDWFATGDLGFWHDGQLVVTGRFKEILQINKKHLYPIDLEMAVATVDPMLHLGSNAAFIIDETSEPKICMVQVLSPYTKVARQAEIAQSVYTKILEVFLIKLKFLVFIEDDSLAKTPSGKIQRGLCKKMFLNKKLKIVNEYCFE